MPNTKNAKKEISPASAGDFDVMASPGYIDKSCNLISEALQKGFDVLQLENGDIVTTGTKTIVTTYRWDDKSGKMTKISTKETDANGQSPFPAITEAKEGQKPKK